MAVEKEGTALQYFPEELKNNVKIVQAAVKQKNGALQYASLEMKNNACNIAVAER